MPRFTNPVTHAAAVALITPALITAYKASKEKFLFLDEKLAAADLPCHFRAVETFERMIFEVDPTAAD
jgi:hypothetical protein